MEGYTAVRCSYCDAIDEDTRHAHTSPRTGETGETAPAASLHVISRTLKRLGVPHQVESAEPLTADSSLLVDIVVNRTVFGTREYQGKSILLGRRPRRTASAGVPVGKQR